VCYREESVMSVECVNLELKSVLESEESVMRECGECMSV
jgi:hypothetical protein